MPLRDLVLALAIFGSVPMIFRDPFWGAVVWNWLAFMNPHRYTWEFAQTLRFSLVIAAATLLSAVLHGTFRRIPWRTPVVLMLLLAVWVTITTFLVALNPSGAYAEWDRFSKIVLMVLVLLGVTDSRRKLDWMIWVVVLSLGFFGFKGGLFTIAHGGAYRVGGPTGSFIEGNNELAFALVICLPLMRYLQLTAQDRRIRWGLGVLMGLCGVSILGSWSRGAFVAGAAMTFTLWLRSRRKVVLGVAMALALPVMFSIMPDHYFDRIRTIQTYEEDASATGRINAWKFAWNLAVDNPVFGGGANVFTRALFQRYAPEPERVHDAHSIYFEMLAEQGFVGLGLFLAMGLAMFFGASRLMRLGRGEPSIHWAYDLGAMAQVCIVGYAVGGAFLGLAYFDLPYTIMAFVVLGHVVAERELRHVRQMDSPGIPEPASGLRSAGALRPTSSAEGRPPSGRAAAYPRRAAF
jgi:probable O-glycosylation ligase (exosortase A-associated)